MRRRPRKDDFFRAAWLAIIAAMAFTAPAAASTTLPPRKPGLWETTMTMKMTMNGQPSPYGNRPIVSAICTDAATDADEMKKMAGDDGSCAKFDIEGSGNTYTIDGSCTDPLGGGTMTTHGVITRESDSDFHVVSQTTSSHIAGNMTGDSKWLGACPAGVAPGDIGTMQNGQFVKRSNVFTPPPPQ